MNEDTKYLRDLRWTLASLYSECCTSQVNYIQSANEKQAFDSLLKKSKFNII